MTFTASSNKHWNFYTEATILQFTWIHSRFVRTFYAPRFSDNSTPSLPRTLEFVSLAWMKFVNSLARISVNSNPRFYVVKPVWKADVFFFP